MANLKTTKKQKKSPKTKKPKSAIPPPFPLALALLCWDFI